MVIVATDSAATTVVLLKIVMFPGGCASVVQTLLVAGITPFFRKSFLRRFSGAYRTSVWILLVLVYIAEGSCFDW